MTSTRFKPRSPPNESKALNHVHGPCLIMAGAGMCNAGRILHHLRQNLWRPDTHVIFVGYQGAGTLGRRLVDGAKQVPIFGERIAVRASVHTLGGFSAHAGQDDLLDWFGALAPCRPRVILTHGEANNQHRAGRENPRDLSADGVDPQNRRNDHAVTWRAG